MATARGCNRCVDYHVTQVTSSNRPGLTAGDRRWHRIAASRMRHRPHVTPRIAPELIVRDPQQALRACAREWHGHAELLGLRLRLADLAPGVRRRRTPHGAGARLAPRAAHALAREPRHAGAARPGVRAAARRRLPRHGLPHARASAPTAELERLWAREMPTGVYDARLAALPHAAGHGARRWPSRSAGAAKPACRRAAPTTRCCTSCATPAAVTAARSNTWPRPHGAAPARRARPRDRAPDGAGAPARTGLEPALQARRRDRPARASRVARGTAAAARRPARSACRSASVSTSSSTPGSSSSTPWAG